MNRKEKCNCGCGSLPDTVRHHRTGQKETTLADLPVGTAATVLKVTPEWRGRKKFADIGLVAGAELLMEAHAPFGGLLRVRVLETSMALHRDDAANVMMKGGETTK